jgi:X-linked retinitis pigmentosa GTPase regulator
VPTIASTAIAHWVRADEDGEGEGDSDSNDAEGGDGEEGESGDDAEGGEEGESDSDTDEADGDADGDEEGELDEDGQGDEDGDEGESDSDTDESDGDDEGESASREDGEGEGDGEGASDSDADDADGDEEGELDEDGQGDEDGDEGASDSDADDADGDDEGESASREDGEGEGDSDSDADEEGDEGESASRDDAEGNEEGEGDSDADESDGDGVGAGEVDDDTAEPSDLDEDPAFSEEELDDFMHQFESEAALVVRSAIQRDNSFEMLGAALHEALKPATTHAVQTARDLNTGLPQEHEVMFPRGERRYAEAYQPRVKSIAHRLAIELDDIRSAARKRRERFLEEGQFDRSRLVAAYTGERNVRYQETQTDDTSLAASLLVDLSGSMSHVAREGHLYTAVGAISATMTELQMPHEIRGFNTANYHLKAMNDEQLEPDRAAFLISGANNDTVMNVSVALSATSLLGRAERNKILIGLTDGALSDHDATQQTLARAREKGALTFGVFLGKPSADIVDKLNALYGQTNGKPNWVAIGNLDDFPKRVGKRIADIFNDLD